MSEILTFILVAVLTGIVVGLVALFCYAWVATDLNEMRRYRKYR